MRKLFLSLALSGLGTAALAWGGAGHSAIAEIAQQRLTPAAAAQVGDTLGPGRSLASVASWPDDHRAQLTGTAPWHYVSIPGADGAYDATRHCGNGACAVAQLQRLRGDLRCAATPQARREALLWAVHLVGDLHQPLHAHDDARGGNDVPVVIYARGPLCGPRCQPQPDATNLHAAWDYGLLEKLAPSWGALASQVEAQWIPLAEQAGPGVDGGTPVEWANASHALGQQVWRMTPANGVLDDAYLQQATPMLMRQLALAGLRLGRFLNEAYASTECPRP